LPVDSSRRREIVLGSVAVIALTVGVAALETTQSYFGSRLSIVSHRVSASWLSTFWRALVDWLILVFLLPAVQWQAMRRRLDDARVWLPNLLIHVATAIGFSCAHLAILVGMRWLIRDARPIGPLYIFFIREYFLEFFLIYWGALAGCYAFLYFRENKAREIAAARLQTRLIEARLDALQAQLNPHFLFNTLSSISALAMNGDRTTIVDVLGRLGQLLRRALDDQRVHEVPLVKELEFVKDYCEIQRLRFADRLVVRTEIDPETLGALVPSMIFEPLLENAMNHGIALRCGPAVVEVIAKRDGDSLQLEVRDSGAGFSATSSTSVGRGIGLANTRARLQTLYGSSQELTVGDAPDTGTIVHVCIPFRRAVDEQPVIDSTDYQPVSTEPPLVGYTRRP
jgi:two-component system, LytTR family, sensor kinase